MHEYHYLLIFNSTNEYFQYIVYHIIFYITYTITGSSRLLKLKYFSKINLMIKIYISYQIIAFSHYS